MTQTWNIIIKDKAWKYVRPVSMEIVEEEKRQWPLFFTKTKIGRFGIKFTYVGYACTLNSTDIVWCDSKEEASYWFNKTAPVVFLNKEQSSVKTTTPKDIKPTHLRLL